MPDTDPVDPWCATTARERGVALRATASRVERWLLVEHAAAWGPESVPSGRMPAAAATAVARAAQAAGARLLLVRRSSGGGSDGRWVFAVDSRPGRERVLARHVDDDAALLDLVPPYGPGVPDGWAVHGERLHLVCTHGSHDRCCATRGRPVALAVSAAYGDAAWECSHIGGERFAANLLVLPEGHYFGHVEPDDAVAAIAALGRGELDLAHWRGRSSLPTPVQAAQSFAGGGELLAQTTLEPDVWEVRLTGARVVVRYDRAGEDGAQLLTCGALEPKRAPVFRLVALDR